MEDCVFCQIVNKKSPASVLYEDDDVIAFMDIKPVTKGHALVIPKKHFVTLDDCDEETAKKMVAVLKKLNKAISRAVKSEGILNLVANGEAAGQEVFHLHFHIIPRFKNDGFSFRFPDDYEVKKSREELEKTAKLIREKI